MLIVCCPSLVLSIRGPSTIVSCRSSEIESIKISGTFAIDGIEVDLLLGPEGPRIDRMHTGGATYYG